MRYFLDLFSPDTASAFSQSDKTISGFRSRQHSAAEKIKSGDRLLCYVTKLSRWIGILEVLDGPFEDSKPIFTADNDPFVIRFHVKALVWLNFDQAIPIHEKSVWDTLSVTKGYDQSTSTWTGKFRASLNELSQKDGEFLSHILLDQIKNSKVFSLSDFEKKQLQVHKVRTQRNEIVEVVVPESEKDTTEDKEPSIRESIIVQAKLVAIGERMNYKIWLPRNDRSRVLAHWKAKEGSLITNLPLNYDETTISTIEQIDVIWLKGRSIVRAFEVEHTTSIYSGILRMADLMALQPNIDIRAHIVAPIERKEKVLQEIKRPVFSLLEKGPLSASCSFVSYDSVEQLFSEKLIQYMTDSVLEEFAEYSEV